MKPGHSKCLTRACVILAFVFGLLGCGRSPEKAVKEPRKELAGLNLQFTPDDFVRSAGNGDLTAVKLFLDADMAVDTRGSTTFTALAAAAMRGHLPVVNLLLERGADVNAAPDDGSTPLLHAAEKENLPVLDALLAKGANLNLTNSSGSTALHWAVRRGNTNIVTRLLKHGASTTILETNGMTAVDCAVEPFVKLGFDPKTATNEMVVHLRNSGASFATLWLLQGFTVGMGKGFYDSIAGTSQLSTERFTELTNYVAASSAWLYQRGFDTNQVVWFQLQLAKAVFKVWSDAPSLPTEEPQRTTAKEHDQRLRTLLNALRAGVPGRYQRDFPKIDDFPWSGVNENQK